MASKVKDAVVWYQKKVRPACLSLIIAPGESVARCCCSFVSGSHTCKPRNCVFRLSWGGENQSFECSAHHFYLFKVMSGHLSEARAVLCVHLFRSSGIRSTAGWSSSPPPPLPLSLRVLNPTSLIQGFTSDFSGNRVILMNFCFVFKH